MVIFKNDVASYDGNVVPYYYVAYSGSKIYVLNPRDRKPGKPYLFVKRYNDFLSVEHRGFKGFNDVTESRDLVDDNRVYTNPFFSKYGMTETDSYGNARFRVGKMVTGLGRLQLLRVLCLDRLHGIMGIAIFFGVTVLI